METFTFKLNALEYAGVTMAWAIDRCRKRAYQDNFATHLFVKVRGGWLLLGTYLPDNSSPMITYRANHEVMEAVPYCIAHPVVPGGEDDKQSTNINP